MHSVTVKLEFSYGHRLLNHKGRCARIHGHNGVIEVEFQAMELDERGMVADFGDLKNAVREYLDEKLDHRLILSEDDPIVPILREADEPMLVLETNPTAENLAELIFSDLRIRGLSPCAVRFRETSTSTAEYRE